MKTLLAVDLTHEPERIVDEGVAWSARLGAELDLAYVTAIAPVDGAARDALAELSKRIPDPMRGQAHVWDGAAATEIAGRASPYDLVLTGTHGRSGVEHLVLGSVAEHVVRLSPTPVLVVRGPPRTDPLRVLVAIDVDREDPVAPLRDALPTLTRLGARVDVGTVESALMTAPIAAGAGIQPALGEFLTLRKTVAEGVLASALATVPERNRGRSHFVVGAAGRELARWSAEYDLVVVGTHGRTGLERWWLGSVAERVVRTAQASVLVVPIGGDDADRS